MTPKEKAAQLILQSKPLFRDIEDAKKHAQSSIDSLEELMIEYGKESYELQNMDSDFRYWDKVREELNKY